MFLTEIMSYVEILFDDLEFHECIGWGSFGSVFKASWKSKQKEVAVKKVLRLDNEVCCRYAVVINRLSSRRAYFTICQNFNALNNNIKIVL